MATVVCRHCSLCCVPPAPFKHDTTPTPATKNTPTPTTQHRHQVALAAGYLDPEPRERVVAPRKQVLVVVTAAWRVLAFDHTLRLMWEADFEGAASRPRARVHEVAVLITPRRVRAPDRGLVVVGGEADAGGGDAAAAEAAGGAAAAGATGEGRAGGLLEGVLKSELRWEAEQKGNGAGSSAGGDPDAAEAIATRVAGAGADTSRHFDYQAFEGATGDARWAHRAGSFHAAEELAAAAEELQPQHSFRLDAERLAGRHYGEMACRDFREGVLRALPHIWSGPADTRLEEAAFSRHREGVGAQRAQLAARGAAAARGGGGGGGAALPRNRSAAAESNAIVAHLERGIEVVHLFTGGWKRRGERSRKGGLLLIAPHLKPITSRLS